MLDDGEELEARRVVLACGITHFAVAPEAFAGFPEELVTHASTHSDFGRFAGQDVTVIGAGASALNTAVALSLAGAQARLVARAPSVHFSSPPDGHPQSLLSRMRNPPSGLGPGWKSRVCCDLPGLFRVMPARFRQVVIRRHLGPSSPWHLKPTTDSAVEVLTGHSIRQAEPSDGRVRLTVADAQGQGRRSKPGM